MKQSYELEQILMNRQRVFILCILIAGLLSACSGQSETAPRGEDTRIAVVATTTIVADVVRQVGGDQIQMETLLPVGADSHSFEPAPQDLAKVANASLVFASGAGLEEFLRPMIENAGATARVVEISEGIQLLEAASDEQGNDPHVWTDPNNVLVWVENIRAALSQADPQHATDYQANAERYSAELKDLDAWISEQVASIPAENRRLVTDHLVFGYFASRYNLEQVGAIVPGYSTLASPSAQELAAIESEIQQYGVKAVFVGKSVNPATAQRVAEDTKVKLVSLYTESLSEPGGPAGTYLDYMRFNVAEIAAALK